MIQSKNPQYIVGFYISDSKVIRYLALVFTASIFFSYSGKRKRRYAATYCLTMSTGVWVLPKTS